MTKAAQKLTLAPPQTIPLDKLVIHDGNVRQIKAGVSIESLAADIERRGLLQSLSVYRLRSVTPNRRPISAARNPGGIPSALSPTS